MRKKTTLLSLGATIIKFSKWNFVLGLLLIGGSIFGQTCPDDLYIENFEVFDENGDPSDGTACHNEFVYFDYNVVDNLMNGSFTISNWEITPEENFEFCFTCPGRLAATLSNTTENPIDVTFTFMVTNQECIDFRTVVITVFPEGSDCISCPDSDGDGVCDTEDACPGFDDSQDSDGDGIPDGCDDCDSNLEGTPCDDLDDCTTGDVYDANCNCEGTFQDSDNDSVCDADDICDGFDDTADVNGNGIPDGCDTVDEDNRCDVKIIAKRSIVNISGLNDFSGNISITDNSGNVAYSFSCTGNCPGFIEISNLEAGRYIVNVTTFNSQGSPICDKRKNIKIKETIIQRPDRLMDDEIANVTNNSDEEVVNVFPNPARHHTYIQFGNLAGQKGTIRIFNLLGQQHFEQTFDELPRMSHEINTDAFDSGIYFIHIQTEKGQQITRRLVVDH